MSAPIPNHRGETGSTERICHIFPGTGPVPCIVAIGIEIPGSGGMSLDFITAVAIPVPSRSWSSQKYFFPLYSTSTSIVPVPASSEPIVLLRPMTR